MKKFFNLLLLTLILQLNLEAQKEINYSIEEKEIGKNRISGKTISAKEYRFEERVHDFEIDTINNYISLQLRATKNNEKYLKSKGQVVRYSIDDKSILWSKQLNFASQFIEQFGGITIYSTGGKNYCLHNESGEQLWEIKTSILYVFPQEKIAIGYSLKTVGVDSDILRGIDLNTGNIVWKRKISREYSWNDITLLNDSTLLIAASGLHSVNMNTGKGWDYNAITGKKDYTASAIATGAGVALGLLTGTYVVRTGPDLVTEVNSNAFIDSLYIYFASKEHLVKLNMEGEILWQKDLLEGMTSKSIIYMEEGKLLMINQGYAKMGYRDLVFGEPFLAAFNPDDGEQIYIDFIKKEKKEFIEELKDNNSHLLFLINNKISRHQVESGEKTKQAEIDEVKYGKPDFFIGNSIFVKRDSNLLRINKLDTTLEFIYTKKEVVIGLNEDLEVTETLKDDLFYVNYFISNKLSFVGTMNKTYIVNEKGEIIADLNVGRSCTILNDKLYAKDKNSILVIDLDSIY